MFLSIRHVYLQSGQMDFRFPDSSDLFFFSILLEIIMLFQVDYNLYGMGHLHVTKMKFRHPTPDSIFSKRVNNHMQVGRCFFL